MHSPLRRQTEDWRASCAQPRADAPPQLELCFVKPVTQSLPDRPTPSASGAVEPDRGPLPTHLGELLARLEAIRSTVRRHVETKSAIRKMGDAMRRPLQEIPTDPRALRELIRTVTPAAAGLSKPRWSRIRSLVLATLRDSGCDLQPGRDIAGHSQAWKALALTLTTRAQRFGLSRFMSYCTKHGVDPEQVTVSTFTGFAEAMEKRSLCTKADAVSRGTVRHWNRAVAHILGWPQVHPVVGRHPRYYSFDWGDFPASFVTDVEAFLVDSGSEDELDEHYVCAVRPATIEQRRRQLRQLASLLVLSGFPIGKITSLAVLADVENAIAAMRQQKERQNGRLGISDAQHVWLLTTIAKHWVKDSKGAEKLRTIAKNLNVKPKGMTDRNRGRLRQFDREENVQKLLQLPRDIFGRARREKLKTPEEARRVMMAVAVELLTVAPMRVGNLCTLELDRHIRVTGRGSHNTRHIVIPAAEMKSGREFEMVLPPETSKMIDLYLKVYRPIIQPNPSPFLFPSVRAEHRAKTSFSSAISRFLKRETGIIMHAHLFRHLAGKLYLRHHPDGIETVRRVLQHGSSATTRQYYAEERTSQAFQAYDATVARIRSAPHRSGRRPGGRS